MSMNDIDNNQKGGAPVPPPFGGEQPTPPTFNEGENTPTPPAFGAPKSAPTPPPVPASAKAEAQPAVETEDMTTSSKKKRTKSVTDKPKKKKKGCMAKGCMWAFIVFLFLGVIGVVFGEDESNKPTAPESSTAKVEQTTAAADDDEASTATTSRKPFKGSVLALSPSKQYVNDYACILTDSTVRQLEDSLAKFSRTTSNQITILTVLDLEGLTPNEFATKIGDTWGVGQKKLDNGVVILFKPKTKDSKGEVYIAPGRGLEGALPDAFCNRVIQHEMIPHLKAGNNNYAAATWAALKVIMPVCRGEFTYDNYQKKHYANGEEKEDGLDFWGWALIIFTGGLILFFVVDKLLLNDYFSDKWGLNSSRDSDSGSDSDSYSSSDSSDWGGGSFGGGGAGGSW